MFNIFNAFGNYNNFQQQFNAFKQNFYMQNNISPRDKVQQLLNSGQMTQEQFERLRMIANQITGKNYYIRL